MQFQHAEQFFRGADLPLLAALVAALADVALVVDADGVVRDLTAARGDAVGLAVRHWRDQALADLLDQSGRAQLDGLCARVCGGERGVELDLCHAAADGSRVPVRYTAFALGEPYPLLLIGRAGPTVAALAAGLLAPHPLLRGEMIGAPDADPAAAPAGVPGGLPLKDLVRDATAVLERTCIEAALRLTGDNRSAAARMLGLSRQSLYIKLGRFGLAASDGLPDSSALNGD